MPSSRSSAAGSQETPMFAVETGPAWAREAAISIRSRPSRASSIRSTWTKTSIGTLQEDSAFWDMQSSQDGDLTYLGSWSAFRVQTRPETPRQNTPAPPDYDGPAPDETLFPTPTDTPTGPVSQPQSAVFGQRGFRSDSAPPEVKLNVSSEATGGMTRDQSFTRGREDISVHRRHASSDATPNILSPPIQSQSPGLGSPATNLRRRNGLKIKTRPSLDHTGQGVSPLTPYSGRSPNAGTPRNVTPAGATFPGEDEPSSPAYLGRGATGTFPSPGSLLKGIGKLVENTINPDDDDREVSIRIPQADGPSVPSQDEDKFGKSSKRDQDERKAHVSGVLYPELLTVASTPAHIEEGDIETHTPPPMDTENDIVIHYTRLVRKLDNSYQKEIRTREDEIGETRAMIRELAEEVASLKAQIQKDASEQRQSMATGSVSVKYSSSEQPNKNQAIVSRLPPLSPAHVRTIRAALGRRVDKLRKKLDGRPVSLQDLDGSPKDYNPFKESSASKGVLSERLILGEAAKIEVGASQNDSSKSGLTTQDQNAQRVFSWPCHGGSDPQTASVFDELNSQNRSLRADVINLQATVETLRSSLDFWTTRCESLERQREDDLARQAETLFPGLCHGIDINANSDAVTRTLPAATVHSENDSSASTSLLLALNQPIASSSATTTPTGATGNGSIGQLTELEKQQLSVIARARHAVEDMWEVRWKDRDRQLLDRMRRIELESQRNVEQAVSERDEEWAVAWAKKNRQILQHLQERENEVRTLKRQLRMAMRALNYGIDTDEIYEPAGISSVETSNEFPSPLPPSILFNQ
ncbi:hypothetical protein L228DRAFT_57498 [Xylona heveae TC161]|uniref:Uncharacterized protein n=1 Tax=Xylona heveae (strain CBS 132557 / TC161) TaxID=1328760 RepID=A0A165IGL0_XYLHT|nr:hypothetical protein L228DRAFT_57498 [Xylona heveae TC161]KZF24864.1 hypothetical protein L228DRAFT_57498 [Xylona heveae TC161]